MWIGRLSVLGAIGIALGIASFAQSPRDAARRIEEKVIAPCCWSESVGVHRSESAAQMRSEIERQVAAGRGEREILNGFITRYGERILLEPRGAKSQWLVWTPLAALFLGFAGLALFMLRRKAPVPATASAAVLPDVRDDEIDW